MVPTQASWDFVRPTLNRHLKTLAWLYEFDMYAGTRSGIQIQHPIGRLWALRQVSTVEQLHT